MFTNKIFDKYVHLSEDILIEAMKVLEKFTFNLEDDENSINKSFGSIRCLSSQGIMMNVSYACWIME
jgi:hypothetical protein